MSIDLQIQRVHPSHLQIQSHIRQQIQAGVLKPGERLPPNMELARRWAVSCTAVQKAFASLTAEGLLARAPRRGTYVQPATEKATIGVLFGPSLSDETAYFYRSVLKNVRSELAALDCACRAYDGLSLYDETNLLEQTQALAQATSDLRQHNFKGLILVSPDHKWPPQIDSVAKLPQAVWSVTRQRMDCNFDMCQFGKDSVQFLAGLGHRRLIYLQTTTQLAEASHDLDGFLDAVKSCGLPEPQIEQLVFSSQGHQQEREMEERTERLIREWTAGEKPWPDALIANDDIIMRGVALALIRNNVKVPKQLRVLAFATDGVHLHYGIPVIRFEFPTSTVVRRLTDLLWRRIQGEAEPQVPILVSGKIQNTN